MLVQYFGRVQFPNYSSSTFSIYKARAHETCASATHGYACKHWCASYISIIRNLYNTVSNTVQGEQHESTVSYRPAFGSSWTCIAGAGKAGDLQA